MTQQFRFRLTAASKQPGIFRFDQNAVEVYVEDGIRIEVVARDAAVLKGARTVHFDGHAFPSEAAAREAGERLRLRLRVLDAVLGLGLKVPLEDSGSSTTSQELKDNIEREHDVKVVESVWGLSTTPDDGKHVELVVSARAEAYPSDPSYLLASIKQLWDLELDLDRETEDALNIIGMATQETSDRAAFLATYLALESLIPRKMRSEDARAVIDTLRTTVLNSSLDKREIDSLLGAFAMLKEQSFRSTLLELADRIREPAEVHGRPIRKFLSECVDIRNAIAHRAKLEPEVDLRKTTAALRHFVLTTIWSRNRIPTLSINVPPSEVTIPAGGFSIRVL